MRTCGVLPIVSKMLFAFIASGCFQKFVNDFIALAILSLINDFYEPIFVFLCYHLLRRTLQRSDH